jgi:hypothetical protein
LIAEIDGLDVSKAIASGGPPPAGVYDEEKRAYEKLKNFFATGAYWAFEMTTNAQVTEV